MNNFESSTTPKPPRFPLGQVYCTPAAAEALQRLQVNPLLLLGRHISGDPGCLCTEDIQANELALRDGSRIFSAYQLTGKSNTASTCEVLKVWLITEADRSSTTILLPEDY